MFFKKIKEIKSKDGVLHFRRWRILTTPWFVINLHGIYMPDEDKHLHNHPWSFINIVLKGWYTERLMNENFKIRFPGSIIKRNASAFHKIDSLESKSVYTLNIMWGTQKSWGYNVEGKFIDHETYRELKRNKEL